MCTLTFIPSPDGFTFTSSRDEMPGRPTLPPRVYDQRGAKLIYPKDETGGGTWIAAGDVNRLSCIMNGGFEPHERKPSYRKSRGMFVLESFNYASPLQFWEEINLMDIEPFTLIILDFKKDDLELKEFRWDGEAKHETKINSSQPQIWSSAPLYNQNVQNKKKQYFITWLKNSSHVSHADVFDFHLSKHEEDPELDFVIKRPNGLQTVSVTQVKYFSDLNKTEMRYRDLVKEEEYWAEF